jgi:putative pyrroloquinoline-quinone binding quinoprotein
MYRSAPTPLLVVAFAEKVFGIDRETGEIRWRVLIDALPRKTVELAVDDDVVIAVSGSALAFIDYATGDVRKHVLRKDVAKTARPVMLLDERHLYIGGTGELACYTRSGDLVWEQPFKDQGFGEIALGIPGRVRQADETG